MTETPKLKEFKLASSCIYGPVKSRRLGVSLGVNVLPFSVKVCSFNCPYCQCDWTYEKPDRAIKKYQFPDASQVASELKEALLKMARSPDWITLAGNGEPTMHPDFHNVVKEIIRVRNEVSPTAKVTILSDGAHMDSQRVIDGLNLLDERIIKLDAGNEKMFKKINIPLVQITLEKIVCDMAKLKDVTLQAMFTWGKVDNSTDEQVKDWISCVKRIKPKGVQIYSVDRFPADENSLKVSRERLEEIAQVLRTEVGIEAQVC